MKRVHSDSGTLNPKPSEEKRRITENEVEDIKKKKKKREDRDKDEEKLQEERDKSLDEQLQDKDRSGVRIHTDSKDSDPQTSKEKKRRREHQEDEDQELKRKRERISDEQLPDECCREKKQRRIETDEGEAGPESPEAQSSRLNPLSVTSYTFFSELGAGTFGKVMLAALRDSKSYVAVKAIKKTEETDDNSLLTESQVLNIARYSPFLCQGYAAFQTQRHAFYVMEYLSGGSLENELLRHGTLDMERVRFHSAEMICGLQYLHGVGIIHRDIKPVNVLLDHRGHVKISDFGLAKQSIFEDDLTTGLAGTLVYMAPEILQEKAYNAAVDWWAFGVTICEMATGMSPFNDSDINQLKDSIKFHEPEIPDWLDDDLKHLLGKLLEKDRKQRLGVRGDIRSHSFYKPIDWVALEEEKLQPPFQPRTPSAELFKPYNGKLSFLGSQEDKATSGDSNIIAGFSFQSSTWLPYFLKVTIVRRLTDLVKEYDLIVHQLATYPDVNNSIKMEVGIEDCLHIEFEYNKSKYHLKDVIVGKIYFLLVRIKIQHMELQLIKKEITGIGPSTTTETETVAKYEIMDGAPVKGESIPIRLFIAGYDPTPTMRDVNKKFSVRYFLNLVLVDEEDRRYFKQQEIVLWRKAPEKIKKRTNFHQRFEPQEPQASAEEPEI